MGLFWHQADSPRAPLLRSQAAAMVLKTTNCRFSGLRLYPGKGILFVRVDGQQYLILNKKCKRAYHNKLRRAVTKSAARSIGSVSLEVIQKKRAEKPEVRKASREAALREIKERQSKMKAEKAKAAKAAPKGKAAPKVARGKK